MRFLCLQHVPFEGPAALADWAATRGHSLDCHGLYDSTELPPLENFDGIFIMGGPMNIDEEAVYPWLAAEKTYIRAAMEAGLYVVGICLGAQLIANMLGSPVNRGPAPEIGWFPIQRTAPHPEAPTLPDELTVLHWHSDQFELPEGATRLARSEICENQGFIFGSRVLALQCHLESTPASLAALISACGDELADGPTIQSAGRILDEPDATYAAMHSALFAILDQMSGSIDLIDWGRTDYEDAFTRQKSRVEARRSQHCGDALIFTEHAPVYTMGLRKGAAQHLIWNAQQCAEKGIQVHQTNRGGDITYHGPGQLVGYPIISLRQRKDLHAYLRDLEEVVIRTLATFGLAGARRPGKTGIWIDQQRKICAIGVAVRSWVTYHGFALNVSPDMSHFSGIVPCGITDGSVTSLTRELGHEVDIAEVKARLAVEFRQIFANTA
jgi:lipoate-protein ligase B